MHPQVRNALGSKVSKERIGTELQGMIDGEHMLWHAEQRGGG